ncbi:MAG: glycosyltransferase family 2 protein, partial [Candidatus Omnitrophica bacterium]|nr:glycosyltransferase family 2 protein [Candidatus Omnitrophota bacterium]
MNDPFVSIIIPAKDAEKTIERCVFSVVGLDYTQYEVIVVDDGSRDKTGKMLQGFSQRIKIISFPQNRGPSKARNDAAIQARGEFIAFTDADCVVDKSWLRALLAGFSGPDIVSVGGRQEVPVDESAFGRNVAQGLKRMGLITDYLRNSD